MIVNEMKTRYRKDIFLKIRKSDVILVNGNKNFVCLYHNSSLAAPCVILKYAGPFNYCILKAAQLMGVPCFEQKVLTQSLFENVKENECISEKLSGPVARIYWRLEEWRIERPDWYSFQNKLNQDVLFQLFRLEDSIFNNTNKRFFASINSFAKQQFNCENIISFMQKKIKDLSEKYNLKYSEYKNYFYGTKEFYLESTIEKYNYENHFMVILLFSEQKIYVGNLHMFASCDFSNAEEILVYLDYMLLSYNDVLKRKLAKYCAEYKINLRLYDIAVGSIKTLLETNYNHTGIEYKLGKTDAAVMNFYLKVRNKEKDQENDDPQMYEVCITYKEFLRNPNAFKKLIEAPRKMEKWNFWCRKRKYRPEIFKENICHEPLTEQATLEK